MTPNRREIGMVLSVGMLGTFLETAALLSFVLISKATSSGLVKETTVGFFAIAMLALLWKALKALTWQPLLMVAGILPFGYVLGYHLIAFSFFPGLLKDIQLWSYDHFTAFFPIILFLFFGYLLVLMALAGLSKMLFRSAR